METAVTPARAAALAEPPAVTPAECCPALTAPAITDADAALTATLFKALSDPHRVRIVNLLANHPDPVCVCDITVAVGLRQPTVSFHLKKLMGAGLLDRERRGVWGYYSLNKKALRRLSQIVNPKGAHR